MKFNKMLIAFFIIFTVISINAQSSVQEDKFTTMNIIVSKVTTTELGLIVEYYASNKFRYLYLPNNFFINGTAVKVVEDDPHIAPQMNIIYKNLAPLKVKLYVPSIMIGLQYPAIEFLTKELIDKFKNTTKLEIILKD